MQKSEMGRELLQQVINRAPISTHLWVHIHRVIINRTLRSTTRCYLPTKMSFGTISAPLAVGDTSHVGNITPTSGGITCLLIVANIKKICFHLFCVWEVPYSMWIKMDFLISFKRKLLIRNTAEMLQISYFFFTICIE